MPTDNDILRQWQNPKDILSLLLILGGNVVQRALAQLFGIYIQPTKHFPRIYITPVAFSFGWVAFAFTSLATAVIGDKQLMPSPDTPSMVINCKTGFARTNRSWVLGRILRDFESSVADNPGDLVSRVLTVNSDREKAKDLKLSSHIPLRISLRIDILETDGISVDSQCPTIDKVWILGWVTIIVQLVIAVVPWVLYRNWSIFLITAAGTLFALLTGSLRQWRTEKWPGRTLNPVPHMHPEIPRDDDIETGTTKTGPTRKPDCKCKCGPTKKTVCLTQGNGYTNVMVIKASGSAWDLETLATARSKSLPETPWCLVMLAAAWVCLLITVSGLEENTWYLVAIGALGMLQNLHASSAHRPPESMGLTLRPSRNTPPVIIGTSTCEEQYWYKDKKENDALETEMVTDQVLMAKISDPTQIPGVRGATRELEKTIPGAGFALMPVFFPAVTRVEKELYRDKAEERFWELSFATLKK